MATEDIPRGPGGCEGLKHREGGGRHQNEGVSQCLPQSNGGEQTELREGHSSQNGCACDSNCDKETTTKPNRFRLMNGRAPPGRPYVPTQLEHIANMVTHGLWIGPALLGMVWMLKLASTPMQHFTALIYGSAVLALFSVSTTYHTISYSGKCSSLKNFFHIGDRAVIYIFIAASYTPWLALKDYDGWGEMTLWVVWIAAMLGIAYQYTFHEQYKWLETVLYIVIGVCPSVVIFAMQEPTTGLHEMAVGGAVYISGVFFFKCDGLIPFAHAIWHCFVSVGAVFHFLAVCVYLLGPHNELPTGDLYS